MLKEKEPESLRQPDENDTRPVSGRGGDRLLLKCLVASLLINFGFGVWLSLADLNGEKGQQEENKVMHFKTYIPPVKKPKPPKPPKIVPPKIIPKVVTKIQPPRPQPPRPQPIAHQVTTTTTHSVTAIPIGPATPPAPPTPATPSDNTDVPTPHPSPTPQPLPPTPAPVPPTPPAPAPPAPKPTPPAPPKPANYQTVQSREAGIQGVDAPDSSTISDPTQITGECIVSYEVTESGHITSVRVKKSSGSHEYDQLCVDAVQKARGIFAVQNHIPYGEHGEQTFSQ